jgi:hypothetical protein
MTILITMCNARGRFGFQEGHKDWATPQPNREWWCSDQEHQKYRRGQQITESKKWKQVFEKTNGKHTFTSVKDF